MQTVHGEFYEEDIETLEYQLQWYLRYGNVPSAVRRESKAAKVDYGRQYERYIGYLFEREGYRVTYRGLRAGLKDGGIDLVARLPRQIRLVQCKRWQQPVSADVLSRLQGAKERFVWEERQGKSPNSRTGIVAVLITSGVVEPDAKKLANHLGIVLMERIAYQSYPAIKAKRILPNGGKFLLPFTSGYDRLTMDVRKGDRFFATVREAVAHGFFYPVFYPKTIAEMNRQRGKLTTI